MSKLGAQVGAEAGLGDRDLSSLSASEVARRVLQPWDVFARGRRALTEAAAHGLTALGGGVLKREP